MRIALAALLLLAWAAHAADWSSITNADASAGMKGALVEGAGKAVSLLGTENGYFGNPKVKIPLPPAIARAESALRSSHTPRSSPRWAHTTAWKQLSHSHCHGYNQDGGNAELC